MTSRQLLAVIVFISLISATSFAAEAPSRAQEYEGLAQQYLGTKNPELRRQVVGELKALAKNSPAEDAGSLNAAVSAMLPAAGSAWEAEELLRIGAANPPAPQAGAASLVADTEYLVDPRRAAAEARHPNGDVETLADIRIDHLQKDRQGRDGLVSAEVQKVWRVNTEQGARSFSPRSVMYSGMSETLSIARAQVLTRDGRKVDAVVSADQPVEERDSSTYFDARSREVRFSHLRPGDLVVLEYRLLPAVAVNPWAGYYARMDLFRDSFVTRLWRRVLIAPTSMKLYAVERGLGPAAERQTGGETTRIWEAHQIAPDAAAQTGEPFLHVSTIGSLDAFGRWYNQLLKPALKLDGKLQAEAQQILERNLTTLGKVRAVYASVQRTKYVAFEFGVHSYQPYPVSMVESRGFGDCKDKAAMLVALLRAVGVPAEFAMVRTRSEGVVEGDAYSVQLFDHAMAYIPELHLYVDGTSEYASPEILPLNDQGAMAMTVDAMGRATRREVPFGQANRMNAEVQAHPAGEGRVELVSQKKVEDRDGAGQRPSYDLKRQTMSGMPQSHSAAEIAQVVAGDSAEASLDGH